MKSRSTGRARMTPAAAVFRPVLFILATACGGGTVEWSSGLPTASQSALERWFFCDECDNGERAAAAALSDTAVTPLDRVLQSIPASWQGNLRSRYGTVAKRSGLSAADSTAYVQRHLGNFVATVQSRAGFSLGDIKTPAAIDALRRALQDSAARGYRPDVVRDLRRAQLAATATPVNGAYANVLAFLDTVWVAQQNNTPWDLDERVTLHGAPFPHDVTIGFRSSNRELGFVAAGRPGEYAFSVSNVGQAQQTQFGEVQITSFPARRPATVPNLTAGPFPLTILQSLSRSTSPPDPVHLFRFQPASALTVTATATWTGGSQIDLIWEECGHRLDAIPVPGRIRGVVMDAAGNSLAGAMVTLVGTSLSVVTGGGVFEVSNVPPGWTGRVRVTRVGFGAQELVAWEGAGILRFVLPFPVSGGVPLLSELTSGASPLSATQTIPGGSCRLLGVLKSDTGSESPIIRLSITQ